MTKLLFIGNFLSRTRGTIGPSEQVVKMLKEKGFDVKSASHHENIFLRLVDILLKCLFSKYDFVHIDVFSGKSFFFVELGSWLAKVRNKNISLTLHGGRLPEYYQDNKSRLSKVFNRVDSIFCPSKFIQSFFKKEGFEVSYKKNSINLDLFKSHGRKRKEHSILWIRGFQTVYNPEVAIRIVEILKEKYPTVSMTMIGPDLGLRPSCERLIKAKKLSSNITITGAIKNENLPKYLNNHYVFINTTSYESFGVALLEAAACRIPIVSSSVGEIPLLWEDKKEMLLTSSIDPQEYAFHISRIFESKELVENLVENARKKAEQYNIETIVNEWDDYFSTN